MDDNKKKYAYWMRPSLVQEIESLMGEANATSKSDFVCTAVSFYIGYLRQQKIINYLAPVLAAAIKEDVYALEQNVSRIMFQVAVEQSKLNNLMHIFMKSMKLLWKSCRISAPEKLLKLAALWYSKMRISIRTAIREGLYCRRSL